MNIKEVVLFFKENQIFNPEDISNELLDRYKELGKPLMIPASSDPKCPLIIFKDNPDFQIQISKSSANIILYSKDEFDNISSYVFDIIDTFEEYKCYFNRIGYITTLESNKKNVERLYLNFDALEDDLTDFNLAWYKKINLKKNALNAWERVIIEPEKVLFQYDINSLVESDIDFNMKYIKEFFKVSDEFISKRYPND